MFLLLSPLYSLLKEAFLILCMDLYSLIVSQLSFQMWTNQIQETLNSKKRGDSAFRARDFFTAIDCYTQVSQLELLGM